MSKRGRVLKFVRPPQPPPQAAPTIRDLADKAPWDLELAHVVDLIDHSHVRLETRLNEIEARLTSLLLSLGAALPPNAGRAGRAAR